MMSNATHWPGLILRKNDSSFCRYDISSEFVVTTNIAVCRYDKLENLYDKMSIAYYKKVFVVTWW
jgi:hypothetical protein